MIRTERDVACDVVVVLLDERLLDRNPLSVEKVAKVLDLTQPELGEAVTRMNGRIGPLRLSADAMATTPRPAFDERPRRPTSHQGPRNSQPTRNPDPSGDNDMAPIAWRKRIGELLDNGTAPEDAAALTLAEIPAPDRDEHLMELLKAEAESARRNRTHTRERRVAAEIAGGADPVAARRQLVNDSFALPDGTWVAHLEATAADHLARAGWLNDHAAGVKATAKFHEDCASAIKKAKVTCLADLDAELRPAKAA